MSGAEGELRTGPPPCERCLSPAPFRPGTKVRPIRVTWFQRTFMGHTEGPFTVGATWCVHDEEEGHIELMTTNEFDPPQPVKADCYEAVQ